MVVVSPRGEEHRKQALNNHLLLWTCSNTKQIEILEHNVRTAKLKWPREQNRTSYNNNNLYGREEE